MKSVVAFKKELAQTKGSSGIVKKRLMLQTAVKHGFDHVDLGILKGSLLAVTMDDEDFSPLKAVVKLNKAFKKE